MAFSGIAYYFKKNKDIFNILTDGDENLGIVPYNDTIDGRDQGYYDVNLKDYNFPPAPRGQTKIYSVKALNKIFEIMDENGLSFLSDFLRRHNVKNADVVRHLFKFYVS